MSSRVAGDLRGDFDVFLGAVEARRGADEDDDLSE